MVYQHGSPFYDEDEAECRKMHQKVFRCFPVSRVYQAHIPTCSSGYWLFGFASKKYHPVNDFNAKRLLLKVSFLFYSLYCFIFLKRRDASRTRSARKTRIKPVAVLNVALPYQDLTIMEACLKCGVHYIDTANYLFRG